MESFFSELGEEGWELISAFVKDKNWSTGGTYVFKRQKF